MERTVNREFATFLTQAGAELMSRVMRGEATIKFSECRVGDGSWSVTRNEHPLPAGGVDVDYTIDVPEQLVRPLDDGLFDIDVLAASSSGVTEARVNVPPTFGPATINEAEWLLDDGTVYAITRYAAIPAMPPETGGGSEVALRAFIKVGDVDAVSLVVESGVTASRDYVDAELAAMDQKLEGRVGQAEQQLSDLPVSYLVTSPVLTGDSEQAYGNNISLSVSGGVSAWHNTAAAATIDHYEWRLPDNSTATGPALIWPVPNDPALVDTAYLFTVRAVDTEGNWSGWVEQTVTVVGNRRPNVDGFTHDVPGVAVKSQVVQVQFSGATDPDGDDAHITYRISNPVNLTASKDTGIAPGEAVTLTFAGVAQDSSAGLTVVAVDQAGTQSSPKVITVDLRHQAIVVQPAGLAPAAGTTDIAQQPNIAGTAFATNPAGFGTHNATNVRVATDAGMTNVVVTMALGAVTSAQISQALALDTQHWYQLQYGTAELGLSDWSEPMAFTTISAILPQDAVSIDVVYGNGANQKVTTNIDAVNYDALVWGKTLDKTGKHILQDTVRGDYYITTYGSNQQFANTGLGQPAIAYSADGFTLQGGFNGLNGAGDRHLFMTFREAPRFFKILKWQGNGDLTRKFSHELGIALGMGVVKCISHGGDIYVKHRSLPGGHVINLNSTQPSYANDALFGVGFEFDDTEFQVGGGLNDVGREYVAYLWAHDESPNGIVQCGAYTGISGNTWEKVSAVTGWPVQFFSTKEQAKVGEWVMADSVRGTSGIDKGLFISSQQAEVMESSSAFKGIEFVSNGVDVYGQQYLHSGGVTNIWLAIRAQIPV